MDEVCKRKLLKGPRTRQNKTKQALLLIIVRGVELVLFLLLLFVLMLKILFQNNNFGTDGIKVLRQTELRPVV